ncbi:MAG: guanylate kinase [Clostridia bacterium]|nr:guanylate kinase [Clostridia bacterium]
MNKGSVFIISGPSGSGKDTLLVKLFEKCPEIKFSISSVTRNMREGEKEGEKYNFISREKFESMIKNDELLEYNLYVDNYYGTPREPVERAVAENKDVFIEVDVNGAESIRKKLPEAISIFIMPPSFEELKRRLSSRGTETEEIITLRMAAALDEIKRAVEYDYIVVNDDLSTAVEDIISIIRGSKFSIKKQKNLIDEVLLNVKS